MNRPATDVEELATRLPEPPDPPDPSYTPLEGERDGAMTGGEAERRALGEQLVRAGRIQVAMLAGVFLMLAAMLGAGAVGFTALSGQILDTQQQTSGQILDMQEQIGGQILDMQKRIGGLSARMASVETAIGTLSDRMTGVETAIRTLSDRMTGVETVIRTHLVPKPDASSPSGP